MINRLLFPLFLICGIASTPVFSAESSGIAEDLSEEDKLYGLSLFWKEASYNFAFFDQVPNLDFDSAYREYIPRVLATENTYEYYRELMKFNALLQDGHTNIYLPEGLSAQYEDWPAVYMTEANQEAIVSKVDVALQAEIPLGSSIISVEGVDLETHLKTNIMPYIASSTEHILWDLAVKNTLDGPADSTVNFTIKTPSGELKEVSLRRDSRNKNIEVASLELPKIDISLKMLPSDMELFEFRWLENDLAYIALNGFHDEAIVENFKAAYPEIKKAKGLIIDLRFNGGGNSNIGAEILSYLTNQDLEGSIWKTRKHVAVYKAWGSFGGEHEEYARDDAWEFGSMGRLEAQEGDNHIVPTYVLIGRYTGSAAEDFLVYADKVEHFTTIGEKTYGSTGQPIFFDLPGGGSFRVCTKRDTYPDGREFVGYGISPDILIERLPEHLIREEDVVYHRAVEEITREIKTEIQPVVSQNPRL